MTAAAFRSTLSIRRIEDTSRDGRGTWRVLAWLTFWSAVAGQLLRVPRGFITDLASVPRMPFIWLLAGGIGHAAAVLHDWLYTVHLFDRATADRIFYEALLCCGVARWRAWLMFRAVSAFGANAWDAEATPQPDLEREAP